MDELTTASLRRSLRSTPWPAAARAFLGSIGRAGHQPGALLTVGTPGYEPWHLTAHLRDSAELRGERLLVPTLVKREVRPGAPAHLSHGMERLEQAGRGATVLVVSPETADDALLERVDDARRRGSTLLALSAAEDELTGLAHDVLVAGDAQAPFELVSHLVSLGQPERRRWRPLARPGRLTVAR